MKKLGLKHVVITSVDRDDLADGGAEHFARVIRADPPRQVPAPRIEVLTPDFLRKDGAIETVMAARPDVFNHNLETVPRLYLTIRPGARYFASLRLLERAKEIEPEGFTKSGLMVGLGETREEIMQVMDDLRAATRRFSHHRTISAAYAASMRRSRASGRRRNLRAWSRSRAPKDFRWCRPVP